LITVVTFDGTIAQASWTKWSTPGVPSTDAAHTLLQTVDQPGGETGFVQAGGVSAGVLKLSIPPGPPDLTRMNYVRLGPLLLSGENAANYPILKTQLVVNGAVVYTRSFEVDSDGDFFLAQVELGPLNISGVSWRSDPSINGRQIWFSAVAADVRGDDPIPEWG
jgi:hypothetical protein